VKIPPNGRARDAVLSDLEARRAADVDWRSGRVFAYVYDAGRDAEEVCKQAYASFLSENGLDPTAFPSLLRLENEVVGMMAAHVHAPPGAVGTFTSGGTESIILAVKAARDAFRAAHPDVERPQIVLPHTAHAAFQKAAHYLDVEAVLVPVRDDFRADVGAVRAAIGPRTCLIVGSAPSYAHGVVDPIPELGALALEKGLPLHVDACIGGFLLPYFARLGAPVPPFDFRVPGVTSLSVDLHKYGFAAKGASVVLYRDPALRRRQMYACATWSGYTLVNQGVQSSKSGGPLAAAWAVLHHLGDEGYLALAREMLDATRRLCAGLREIEGLRVLGEPDMNLVAFTAEGVGIFHVADEMKARGWYVQPQLSFGGSPANIHLSVNPKGGPWVDALLADLRASVDAARGLPYGHLGAAVRQALAGLGDEPDDAAFGALMGMAGVRGDALPERMAAINEMLDALPAALRGRVVADFVDDLFRVGPDT
jgi:glutamate/tyrosine decarboxylase-like PLP-dependent enzyme